MSGSDYLDWRDLLDEAPAAPAPTPTPAANVPPSPGSGYAAADSMGTPGVDAKAMDDALPAELRALMAERERLETDLKALIGQAPATAEDERRKRCFPVLVHTKESRIEERRLRLHDERLAMLARRARERALARQHAEERRQGEREAEAALRRQRRRARVLIEQKTAEAQARAQAEAEFRRRWLELRQAALANREAELRRLAAWHEERNAARLAATVAQIQARRRDEAELEAHAEETRVTAQRLAMARRREAVDLERRLDARTRRE